MFLYRYKVIITDLKLYSRRFKDHYNPNHWSANGPILITKILQKICNTTETAKMTRDKCDGFHVYDSNNFYAISYAIFPDAFNTDPEKVKSIFKIIQNSTLVHLSNALSADYIVNVDSPVGYGILAEMYCPKVYHSLEYFF